MRERPLPQLTIQQLDYLVAVADHETWAEAAASLGVTPSALSQGLAELERRLGLTLFERVGRRRMIAESSGPIVDYARGVLAATSAVSRWVDALAAGELGRLRLGLIDIAITHHFATTLQGFVDERPDIDLRVSVAPSTQLLLGVRSDELDLAVLVDPGHDLNDVDVTPLIDEPLGVYGPPGCEHLPNSEWGPWVGFPPTSHTHQLIADALRDEGVEYRLVAESHQPEVLRQMVSLGLGWTVLPVAQAEDVENAITRVRSEPLRLRRLSAIRRSSEVPNPLAALLLERLNSTG